MTNNLRHLAIIMDGNNRWAKKHNLSTQEGHAKGGQVAKFLIPHVIDLGIEYLTLYTFSSENWQRPKGEIDSILRLLSNYITSEDSLLDRYQVKLKIVGNLDKLSDSLQDQIKKAVDRTKSYNKLTLALAFNYGAREEIVYACQKILNAGIKTFSVEDFSKYLYDESMPDVDLLIRTSGVYRVSNFLLWQSAYAELYFTDKFWPDFNENDLKDAVNDYKKRHRNFGRRRDGFEQ